MNPIGTTQGDYASRPSSKIPQIVTGVAVIAVGLIFLADNLGVHLPFAAWKNWWAVLILIGAASPASRAFERYRSIGTIDAQVAHSIISAIAVVTVALIFLFDASFALLWPVFMIIGGLSMLVSGGKRRDRK